MGIYLRQNHLIKPERAQCGSDADVQVSIFKNADSLGIAPPVGLWPLWEKGLIGKNVAGHPTAGNFTHSGGPIMQQNRMSYAVALSQYSMASLPHDTTNDTLKTGFALLWHCQLVGTNTNGGVLQRADTLTSGTPILLVQAQSGTSVRFLIGASYSDLTDVGNAPWSGAVVVPAYNATSYGYINSKIVNSATYSKLSGGNGLYLANGYSNYCNVIFNNVMFWRTDLGKALSDANVAFFTDNPFYLLQPQPGISYSFSAAMDLTQYAFRFRNDDGNEAAATYSAAENTNLTMPSGSKPRIRIGIDSLGDLAAQQFKLEYRHKPSGGSFGNWQAVGKWKPSLLSPIFWIDASTLPLANNVAVSTWEDLSADGFDLTLGVAPTFKTNVLNTNMPVVDFSSDYLTNDAFNNLSGATAFSFFMVAKPDVTGSNIYALGTNGVGLGIQFYNSTYRVYVANVAGYSSFTDTAYNLFGSIFDGSQSTNATRLKTRKNGGAEITLTYSGTIPASIGTAIGITVGRPHATAVAYFDGAIAEIVLFSTVLSTADREKVEGYLAWKWGLQANLPTGHTYEDGAP